MQQLLENQQHISHRLVIEPNSHGYDDLTLEKFYADFCKLKTMPKDPKAASVIQCCKINFSQHGIPNVAVADTAQQCDYKESSNMEKNEGLNAAYQKHTISSQTKKNELAVKIVKKLIKKTEQDGRELWKAILD